MKLFRNMIKKKCCARCGVDLSLLTEEDYRKGSDGKLYCDICLNCLKTDADSSDTRRTSLISFSHGDADYVLEKADSGFRLIHHPKDRFDWSPWIDEALPEDYFRNHSVDQFCSYVENLIPDSGSRLHRGLMQNRLEYVGFIEKAPPKPKKPAAVSPHQNDLRYYAEQMFQRGGLTREQAYGAYGLDINGNPLPHPNND